jgi:large subunit ribosomal protein L19e
MISRSKKRMAASVLKVGKNRAKLDPKSLDTLGDAITKASLKGLIRDGKIWAVKSKGISKGRARKNLNKTRGPGSRKGAKGAIIDKKTRYMTKVRALRKYVKSQKEKNLITNKQFNDLYKQIRGGQVRSVAHLKTIVSKTV